MHKFYDIIGIDMPSLLTEIVASEQITLKIEESGEDGIWYYQSEKTFEEIITIAKNNPNTRWFFVNKRHFDLGFGVPNKLEAGFVTIDKDGKTYCVTVYGEESLVHKYGEKYKIIVK
jgi:hypothetical protein